MMRFTLSILLACFCAGCAVHKPVVKPPPLPPLPKRFVPPMPQGFVTFANQPKAIVMPPAPPPDILLHVILTNAITTIDIPFTPYGDSAVMSCYFDTKDTRPLYGITLTGRDRWGNEVVRSWVQECYVPAMTETVTALLPPSVKTLTCTLYGPVPGKWSNASLLITANRPTLTIAQSGTNVVLKWFSPWGGWCLERQTGKEWCASPATVPNKGTGLFRLKRVL